MMSTGMSAKANEMIAFWTTSANEPAEEVVKTTLATIKERRM